MNPAEKKLNSLRAKMTKLREKREELNRGFSSRYGMHFKQDWLKDSERRKLEELREKIREAENAVTDHIQVVCQRDWSGISWYWMVTEMTFEQMATNTIPESARLR